MPLRVAIVGRANVGKSTLFNKLLGRRRAIVHGEPGVTRDCLAARCRIGDREVELADTGGLKAARFEKEELPRAVGERSRKAAREADCLLFVLDAREGLSPLDEELLAELRTFGHPILGLINKVDRGSRLDNSEFCRLGLRTLEISAEHGLGLEALREELAALPTERQAAWGEAEKIETAADVAILGRPNVGKSSLVNALLGETRVLVSEEPGTTRDAVDALVTERNETYRLIDTAGLRRRGKVAGPVEWYSVVRALRALERADVAVVLVDGSQGLTTQDQKVAAEVIARGRGLLLAVNKWDLVPDSAAARRRFREETYLRAPFLRFAAVRFLSAATGAGVSGILPAVRRIQTNRKRKFSAEELKTLFEPIEAAFPFSGGGAPVKLYGLSQDDREGHTFLLRCSDPARIKPEVKRSWTNRLRETLGLEGVPLRLRLGRRKPKRGPASAGRRASGRPRPGR